MSPATRRIVHAVAYEAIAVVVVGAAFALQSGKGAGVGAGLAAACSAIALVWNVAFNWAFEAWEARQPVRGRGIARRAVHAIGFECGLTALLAPLIAWWLSVSLLEALLLDGALILFFLAYTYVFNLAFDRLFGLPASARG